MTVACLEQDMSEAEFREWQAFYRQEPWGEMPAYHRAGIVAAMIGNVNRGKGQKALSPSDFMPRPPRPAGAPPEGLDPKRVRADLSAIFEGRIVRKDGAAR